MKAKIYTSACKTQGGLGHLWGVQSIPEHQHPSISELLPEAEHRQSSVEIYRNT